MITRGNLAAALLAPAPASLLILFDFPPPRAPMRSILASLAFLLTLAGCADAQTQSADAQARPAARTGDEALRARLTPMQYHVTRENGTEPPFRNAYWDNHRPGIYVDVISGEPLFSSLDQFDSGTGWPSFTRPLEPRNVRQVDDGTYGGMEVRSVRADAHLGHVFEDGPEPTGLRYCMNSAAMRFVPVDRLEAEGLGRYRRLFQRNR